MKFAVRPVAALLLIAGVFVLLQLTSENRQLEEQIRQLEAELGRMPIADASRVHLVEIESPDVPPEVASHLERVWQFRCYLPAGYDVVRFSGGGRVAEEGVYLDGSYGTGWGTPKPEAFHQLVTVSMQRKGNQIETFNAFGGSSGTNSWGRFNPEHFDESVVIEKLVSSEQGPRSFDQDTILPVVRIYDANSGKEEDVAGREVITYAGGMFVLVPKTMEPAFDRLRRGETPSGYEPHWIAEGVLDE